MSKQIFKTRTGRSKEQTVKAYCLFLTILRQRHEQGIESSLKQLAEQVHISSSISNNDLPDDLYTAPYEVVTSLDYARVWLYDYLRPLRQKRRAATIKAKDVATEEQPLGGIFEDEKPQPPSLAEILTEIERLITKAQELINKYK